MTCRHVSGLLDRSIQEPGPSTRKRENIQEGQLDYDLTVYTSHPLSRLAIYTTHTHISLGTMSLTLQSTTTLHTGTQMPTLGYGVYLSERDKCVKSVSKALEVGYRHVDCAQYYENEDREF